MTYWKSLLAGAAGALLLGVSAPASAEPPRIVIEPPVFLPQTDFPYENGYYRTNEGHYYHYDHDRRGWHYGRNHDEGMRYEWEREHHHHHHDRD